MEESEAQICPNCKREIPSVNFTIHTVHCARNIKVCPVCKEPVLQHELQDHHDKLHKLMPCKQCGESVCGTDLEDHIRDSCGHTIKSCRYCELELPRHELPAHEGYCGVRTELCGDCGEWVMIKYRQLHLDSNHGFLRLDDEPAPRPNNNPLRDMMASTSNGVRPANGLRNTADGPSGNTNRINVHTETWSSRGIGAGTSGIATRSAANSSGSSGVGTSGFGNNTPLNNTPRNNTPGNNTHGNLTAGNGGARDSRAGGGGRCIIETSGTVLGGTRLDIFGLGSGRVGSSSGSRRLESGLVGSSRSDGRELSNASELNGNVPGGARAAAPRQAAPQQVAPWRGPAASTSGARPQNVAPPRGAVKKRVAPAPPADRKRDLQYYSAARRQQDEERRRREQSAYNASIGLPPVLSPAAKLEKLRKMDALHNRETEVADRPRRPRERQRPDSYQDSASGNSDEYSEYRELLKDLTPMSPEEFSARFDRLRLAEEQPPASGDRITEIKASLRQLRRELNEVTSPFVPTREPQPPSRSPSPLNLLEVELPCEFCGRFVRAIDLVQHQTGCRPELAQLRPPGGPHPLEVLQGPPPQALDREDLIIIPCEFCTESLPVYLITEHQERCRREYNLLYPD